MFVFRHRRLFAGLTIGLLSSFGLAQTIEVSGPATLIAGQEGVYQVTVNTTRQQSATEVGTRVQTPTALGTTSATLLLGRPLTQTPELRTFRVEQIRPGTPVRMTFRITPSNSFTGALNLQFFTRNVESSTPNATLNQTITVNPNPNLPTPTMSAPMNGADISPSPILRVIASPSTPRTVKYQVQATRAGDGSVRTFESALVTTGTNTDIYVPYLSGLTAGTWTLRARCLDEQGNVGSWSTSRTVSVYGGIDMAGRGSLSGFQQFKAGGWDTFFAAAWGGNGRWPDCRQNLLWATQAGMRVAAYAFINFDNSSTVAGAPANQTGSWQIDQALAATGYSGNKATLGFDLKYMMIDVENRYWGTMSQDDRVQRIAEGMQRARNLGFWTMIYTRNERSNQWWNDATGSSTDFSDLGLWGSLPELETVPYRDDLELDRGAVWTRFGGWADRVGKQWLLDRTIAGMRVDLNTWLASAWNINSPNPGSITIPQPTLVVQRGTSNRIEIQLTVRNTGTVEAYAVRVMSARLNNVASNERKLSLLTIPASGQRLGLLTFPSTAAAANSVATLTYTVWTGMGPQSYTVPVAIP